MHLFMYSDEAIRDAVKSLNSVNLQTFEKFEKYFLGTLSNLHFF